jgi:hypothetical protein
MALHQLERDHIERGERDLVEFDKLRTFVDQLRDESEQLRARVDSGAPVAPPTDRDEELRVARDRIAALQLELAELRRVDTELRALLSGVGIRFREV